MFGGVKNDVGGLNWGLGLGAKEGHGVSLGRECCVFFLNPVLSSYDFECLLGLDAPMSTIPITNKYGSVDSSTAKPNFSFVTSRTPSRITLLSYKKPRLYH